MLRVFMKGIVGALGVLVVLVLSAFFVVNYFAPPSMAPLPWLSGHPTEKDRQVRRAQRQERARQEQERYRDNLSPETQQRWDALDPAIQAVKDAPTTGERVEILETLAKDIYPKDPALWRLVSFEQGGRAMMGRYAHGQFETQSECQSALAKGSANGIRIVRTSATAESPAQVVERPDYVSYGYGSRHAKNGFTLKVESVCYLDFIEPPS